jgi:hypothetical protein
MKKEEEKISSSERRPLAAVCRGDAPALFTFKEICGLTTCNEASI